MATSITVNLDDALEAILNKLTAEANAIIPNTQVTPSQFLRGFVRDYLRSQESRFTEKEQLGMRAKYKLATPEEQAQIDAILNKYSV